MHYEDDMIDEFPPPGILRQCFLSEFGGAPTPWMEMATVSFDGVCCHLRLSWLEKYGPLFLMLSFKAFAVLICLTSLGQLVGKVVAITVFFLLVVAFYAFFAPFLGGRIFEYASIAVYTPVVLVVFILYVRCTAINPADPGILSKFDGGITKDNAVFVGTNLANNPVGTGISVHSSPSSAYRSSIGGNSGRKTPVGAPDGHSSKKSQCCFNIGGLFCALFVKEDCCRHGGANEQQTAGEDALFCTLCNAESYQVDNGQTIFVCSPPSTVPAIGSGSTDDLSSVRRFSKHCRSCDKCVDGFDHHCRLVIECGVGIAVLVRCFVNRKGTEDEIVERLGDGFSRAPFATVVGITTYEYVVAMRAMSEAPAGSVDDELNQNVLYSPTGSATTGVSGGSSLGLQYKGAWCTPPRVFVDHQLQDEVIPHLDPGMVPSTVDPDADGAADRTNKVPKRPVRISAWKLAKLDSQEAMRAAAKARASSSVLRPVDTHRPPDADPSSSGNASVRSSMSMDFGGSKEMKSEVKLSPLGHSYPPSQGSRDDYETGTQSMSSFSSPSHAHDSVALSPLPMDLLSRNSNVLVPGSSLPSFLPDRSFTARGAPHNANLKNPVFQSSMPGFDERIMQTNNADPLLLSGHQSTSFVRDGRRTSVVWDQEAGRYVSVAAAVRSEATLEIPFQASSQPVTANPHGEASIHLQGSSMNAAAPQAEKLTYTGKSIFFGGPLLSVPSRDDSARNESGSRSRPDHDRVPNAVQEARVVRSIASNQFPVFTPGAWQQNGA
ncbi:hypothetical protein ACLOJK_020088 [Asimina triloba]